MAEGNSVADGAGPHVSDVEESVCECLRAMIPVVRCQAKRLSEDFNREFDARFWEGECDDADTSEAGGN